MHLCSAAQILNPGDVVTTVC